MGELDGCMRSLEGVCQSEPKFNMSPRGRGELLLDFSDRQDQALEEFVSQIDNFKERKEQARDELNNRQKLHLAETATLENMRTLHDTQNRLEQVKEKKQKVDDEGVAAAAEILADGSGAKFQEHRKKVD